jgi:hypothetical protein
MPLNKLLTILRLKKLIEGNLKTKFYKLIRNSRNAMTYAVTSLLDWVECQNSLKLKTWYHNYILKLLISLKMYQHYKLVNKKNSTFHNTLITIEVYLILNYHYLMDLPLKIFLLKILLLLKNKCYQIYLKINLIVDLEDHLIKIQFLNKMTPEIYKIN